MDDSNLDLLSKIENEIYSTNKTASFLTNLAGLVSSLERTWSIHIFYDTVLVVMFWGSTLIRTTATVPCVYKFDTWIQVLLKINIFY